jgi:hypothetical protein
LIRDDFVANWLRAFREQRVHRDCDLRLRLSYAWQNLEQKRGRRLGQKE